MELIKRDRLGIDLARQQTKLIRELKAVRVSSGATVAEVAAAMGVDDAGVYRFEKCGTNPALSKVRARRPRGARSTSHRCSSPRRPAAPGRR